MKHPENGEDSPIEVREGIKICYFGA